MLNFPLDRSGGWIRGRLVGWATAARVSSPARLACALAASFAFIAALVPAGANAASHAKLISEAKHALAVDTKAEEKLHLIPYKQSTVFSVSCSVTRNRVLCREHSGPERCVNGKPWTQLSDIYPVIKGRVGLSLTGALVVSSVYCPKHR